MVSVLKDLITDLTDIAYPKAPEQLKPMGLVMFMNGDEVVDMVHHEVVSVDDVPTEYDFVPGDLLDSLSGDITHIIWETPTGCWEADIWLEKGMSITAGAPGSSDNERLLYWSLCQR